MKNVSIWHPANLQQTGSVPDTFTPFSVTGNCRCVLV